MPYISLPALALPPYPLTSAQLIQALPQCFPSSSLPAATLVRMAARSGVEQRFLVRPLLETLAPRALTERSRAYVSHAIELAKAASQQALADAGLTGADIDLVISVSCTGYMLPSLDVHLVPLLGLRANVRRLPITELGCVAGAMALSRAADYVRAYPRSHVLIIAVETPSLTFQPDDASVDNVVSTLLFGDGAAAVVMSGCRNGPGCEVLDCESRLAPGTIHDMGFDLRNDGFWVVLSGAVPGLVGGAVQELAGCLLQRNGLTLGDVDFYCVHPGGPKILQSVGETLRVQHRLGDSWEVLRQYGNLSSVSILFVLNRLYRRAPVSGSYGLLLAFGPGLSLEAILVRWRGEAG